MPAIFLGLSVAGCLGAETDGADAPHEPVGGEIKVRNPVQTPSPSPESRRCAPEVDQGLRPATDLRLDHVYAYQSTEIPLVIFGEEVRQRYVDFVQGRDLLVRAFVTPTLARPWFGLERRAHLTLTSADETVVFEDVRHIRRPSTKEELESTFNFYVPGDVLAGSQELFIELWDFGACDQRSRFSVNRTPPVGSIALRSRATGPIRVHIVPIRYETDGSGRMPDVSPEHLHEMATLLAAVFPASHVELTLRSPVGTTESDIGDILNQLLQLRALEEPPGDVSYYGLVEPAPKMGDYCGSGCVAGVATFGGSGGSVGVGVGIGYRGAAADTFVHELGHVFRLRHAPCGGPEGADPNFPYSGATIGSWGYDMRSGQVIDPSGVRDLMSYCSPTWISDYNYQALLDRMSVVNGMYRGTRPFAAFTGDGETAAETAHFLESVPGSSDEEPLILRTLRLDASGRGRWGLPIRTRTEPGEKTVGRILDGRGRLVGDVEIYRRELSEGQGMLYFVPQPEADWDSIVIEGHGPQSFVLADPVRAFLP